MLHYFADIFLQTQLPWFLNNALHFEFPLQACSKHLQDCESLDDDNKATLSQLSTALAQPFLHQHRSREVRTLVACCIADIFRVFYPEPPYDDNQMRVRFCNCTWLIHMYIYTNVKAQMITAVWMMVASSMQAVFSLFVSQLQGLEKPSSPAFKQSFHLLEVCVNSAFVLSVLIRVLLHTSPPRSWPTCVCLCCVWVLMLRMFSWTCSRCSSPLSSN